ncbi:hypothetical protein SASPL_132105 [Salvia splendens]|uniref:Pectin methylesterase CGR3 n=1 Tax=Salvia splendens TaxID=180675 RepID=A0A8X8XAI0_SALSN|nr:hypothetical protein SASPL_132105 [Salvia splendens]
MSRPNRHPYLLRSLYLQMASRRPNASRRFADSGVPFMGALHHKSRPSPLLSIGLVVVGALLVVGYMYHGSGGRSSDIAALNRLEGLSYPKGTVLTHESSACCYAFNLLSIVLDEDVNPPSIGVPLLCGVSCTAELQRLIPILKKSYGDSMRKVLHVGPETCSVVSQILKEEDTEAWGVEPYELDDADANCKSLVSKGVVRVADIKFPLPYKPKSFSLVVVSDALDYLSPKYINKTVPDLARVASDGLVILSGYPGHQRAKLAELSKFGRPAKFRSSSWWIRFFIQTSLEENEAVHKKFEQAVTKQSYKPDCQVFHLKPLH